MERMCTINRDVQHCCHNYFRCILPILSVHIVDAFRQRVSVLFPIDTVRPRHDYMLDLINRKNEPLHEGRAFESPWAHLFLRDVEQKNAPGTFFGVGGAAPQRGDDRSILDDHLLELISGRHNERSPSVPHFREASDVRRQKCGMPIIAQKR